MSFNPAPWEQTESDTNRDSFTDDFNNRAGNLLKTGGLSGFSDLGHDLKRMFGGGKGKQSTFASDTFAELTRRQWADYQKNTVPYENKLIEFATSKTVAADAMDRAGASVGAAFDRQTEMTQDNLRGLGLTLNADEQAAATRSTGLSRSLAEVQARNQAGMQIRGLQKSLLGNPTPDIQSLSKGMK